MEVVPSSPPPPKPLQSFQLHTRTPYSIFPSFEKPGYDYENDHDDVADSNNLTMYYFIIIASIMPTIALDWTYATFEYMCYTT